MRLRFLSFFLLLFNSILIYAQQRPYNQQEDFLKANSYWVATKADIDFNVNPPSVTANDSSFQIYEGGASVADPLTGELLFYSSGQNCRDRNNRIMPNGDSLFGNGGGLLQGPTLGSTTQGVCIVPMIDSPGKYYLFSMYGPTDGIDFPGGGSLFYSVVDMSLNSGLGDIVTGRKNIVLDTDTLSEAMIAVPGNNCDIWLIVHDATKPIFKAYHITRDGINPNPVISQTGGEILSNGYHMMGGMSVSPNRERIAISAHYPLCYGFIDSMTGVLLCKFDAANGIVSDAIQIEKNLQAYVPAFSPDNNKLYIGNYDHLTDTTYIQQYDISSYDPALINASKTMITPVYNPYTYLRLYKDTIFFTDQDPALSFLPGISTINQPNLSGTQCGFQAFTIKGVQTIPLPNEVVYPLHPDTVHRIVMDTMICDNGGNLELRPHLISDDYQYSWSSGSSDSILTINDAGTYWVTYTNGCHQLTDSFMLQYHDFIFPVINVDEFRLSTTASYSTYQWMLNGSLIPNATGSTYDVTQNGDYQVIVSNGKCTDTSDVYEVTNWTGIQHLSAIADQVSIHPNPANDIVYIKAPVNVNAAVYGLDGKVIRKIEDVREVMVHDLSAGIYFIHIMDKDGTLIKVEKLVKLKSI